MEAVIERAARHFGMSSDRFIEAIDENYEYQFYLNKHLQSFGLSLGDFTRESGRYRETLLALMDSTEEFSNEQIAAAHASSAAIIGSSENVKTGFEKATYDVTHAFGVLAEKAIMAGEALEGYARSVEMGRQAREEYEIVISTEGNIEARVGPASR